MPSSALADRLQCAIARLLARLPDSVKIRLSGEPPIVIDGQQLDPQSQLLRSLVRRRHTFGLVEPTVAAGRLRFRKTVETFRGPMTEVAAVRTFEIRGPAGPLRARHYAPIAASSTDGNDGTLAPWHRGTLAPRHPGTLAPLTVYFHGGGFVIGDLDTHDEPCRILCRHAGVHVLSIDYRLAPEHPFPAAIDDGLAAFSWARINAASLGAEPRAIAIGGDSAGANLATVVALEELRARRSTPSAQLLIYPATDGATERGSWRLFADGFTLTQRDREAFYRYYSGGAPLPLDDPRLSPMFGATLGALPPALIAVAGFDPLRDEGDAYAKALETSGAPVRLLRFPSLEHGFIHLTGISSAARTAMHQIAVAWRGVLAADFAHNAGARQ